MRKYNEVLLKECAYIKNKVAYSFMLELTEAYVQDIAELEAQLPREVVPIKDKEELANWRLCECLHNVYKDERYCSMCGSKLNWMEVEK
jgi:histone deacetylase complex regulatory component SIN3